jgi:hypothetical protein
MCLIDTHLRPCLKLNDTKIYLKIKTTKILHHTRLNFC